MAIADSRSSNLTLSDQSEAHLSSQLPFVPFLQSLCRGPNGCRSRRGTDGNESRVLNQSNAVEVCHRLDICAWSRHLTRSREGQGESDQEHDTTSIFPYLEIDYRHDSGRRYTLDIHVRISAGAAGEARVPARPPSEDRLGIAAPSHPPNQFNRGFRVWAKH
jgi:hypothetical protein